MPQMDYISPSERDVIILHLKGCIIQAENAIARLAPYHDIKDNSWVRDQTAYWQNVCKGLRWSIHMAETRVKE